MATGPVVAECRRKWRCRVLRLNNHKETRNTTPTPCRVGIHARWLLLLVLASLLVGGTHALEIHGGNADWVLRWDNSPKASATARLKNADPVLSQSFEAQGGPQALNLNAGDQNVGKRGFCVAAAESVVGV